MEKLYPNRMGFIEHFLVSGVAEDDFVDDHIDDNQLHYEAFLRSIVPERNLDAPHGFPKIGEISRMGFHGGIISRMVIHSLITALFTSH